MQLVRGVGIRDARLEDHGAPGGRAAGGDPRGVVALELIQGGRRDRRHLDRGAEVGHRLRVRAERRPAARPAGLIRGTRLPVVPGVVGEPGDGDEPVLAVRHAAAHVRRQGGERRPYRPDLDFEPQRVLRIRVRQNATQHDRRLIGGSAGRHGGERIRAQLRQRRRAGGGARPRHAQREASRLTARRRRRLDQIGAGRPQQLIRQAGVPTAPAAAIVERQRRRGGGGRAVEHQVGVQRRRRHDDGDRVVGLRGEGVHAREAGGPMRRRAVPRGDRVGDLRVEHERYGQAGMHHELDRHAAGAARGVLGGHDDGVAIDPGRQTGGIERQAQLRGRRATRRTDEREPRLAHRQPRAPGQGAGSGIHHGETVVVHAQAPHRGRVADLVRREGEGGDRRRGVGELVDLAGGEQYKERHAGNNAQDPPSWGQGPAQSATSPGAPHDLALVP